MTDHPDINALQRENAHMKEALAARDAFIHNTFGRYLTDEVLEQIMSGEDGLKIGGERRIVSMMFTDLRCSTQLSEEMDPVSFLNMLNHFFEEMIEIINAWQGNILEFAGDAIVTVFGAPYPNELSARDAVACAVAMQRRMPAVNVWNQEHHYPKIEMGIGLHTGEAILGNIGSQTRMKYDMIGRNVNLASRVQGFTAGGQILATTELVQAAGELVHVNEKGAMWATPKGFREQIRLHDVVGYGKHRIDRQ